MTGAKAGVPLSCEPAGPTQAGKLHRVSRKHTRGSEERSIKISPSASAGEAPAGIWRSIRAVLHTRGLENLCGYALHTLPQVPLMARLYGASSARAREALSQGRSVSILLAASLVEISGYLMSCPIVISPGASSRLFWFVPCTLAGAFLTIIVESLRSRTLDSCGRDRGGRCRPMAVVHAASEIESSRRYCSVTADLLSIRRLSRPELRSFHFLGYQRYVSHLRRCPIPLASAACGSSNNLMAAPAPLESISPTASIC